MTASPRHFAILAALLWIPTLSAQTASLNPSTATGSPGDLVTLDISLEGGTGPSGLQWTLAYSAADIGFESASPGPAAPTKSIQCSGREGSTICILFGVNTDQLGDGVVAQLTLQILPATVATAATIQLTNVSASAPDGSGIPISGTGSQITIQHPINTTPTAMTAFIVTTENTPVAVTLEGTDPDQDPLGFNIVRDPDHGSLSGTAPNVTYTPDPDFAGEDSFDFQVSDGRGGFDTGTVYITVVIDDREGFYAISESQTLIEDHAVAISLRVENPQGGLVTFEHGAASHGSISGSGPNLTYRPRPNFFGEDSFVFTARNEDGNTDTATVTLHVQPENDPPRTEDQTLATGRNTPLGVTLTADDVDGDPLAFTHGLASHGAVSGSGADLIYTPEADFVGLDTFLFNVTDTTGDATSGTVRITVADDGLPSTAPRLTILGPRLVIFGDPLRLDVAVEDPFDLPIAVSALAAPDGADYDIQRRQLTWRPLEDQVGVHEIPFRAINSAGEVAEVTVRIEVISDQPVLSSIVEAAGFNDAWSCSPAALATLFGQAFVRGDSKAATSFPIPNSVGGTRVLFNGDPTPILFLSNTQANVQCPDLPPGTDLEIVVETAAGISNKLLTMMSEATPGIYSLDGSGSGQGVIVHANTSTLAMTATLGLESSPVKPGDHITLWVNGLGALDGKAPIGNEAPLGQIFNALSTPQLAISETFGEVTFSGLAPGLAGLFQINGIVHAGVARGAEVEVWLEVPLLDGTTARSNTVTLAVE